MGAQPIDYTALAKQAGAISSTPPPGAVDYAALAKQAGAISSTPAQPVPPVDMSNVAGAGPMGLPQPGPAPLPNMAKYAGNLETIPSGADPGIVGGVKTAVHNFGARVGNNLNALAAPVIHPIQTGNAILQRGGFPLTPDAIKAAGYNPSGPDAGATAANVLGDAATAWLTS